MFRDDNFSFKGRLSRSDYWDTLIVLNLLSLFIGLLFKPIIYGETDVISKLIVILLFFPIIWIGFKTQIRRWHDLDKSGWWVLINFIPILGIFWVIIEQGCIRGTVGPNKYGEDPLHPQANENANSESV